MPAQQYRTGAPSSGTTPTLFNESSAPVYILYTGQDRRIADELVALLLPSDAGVIGGRLIQVMIASDSAEQCACIGAK